MSVYPAVSIIITCYNRKNYLLNALESVLNQDVPRETYEVILIKNFSDSAIDQYCSDNDITNIVMDGSVGQYLKMGINLARGQIISFLDDDDQFKPDKISVILKTYKLHNFDYLHNNFIEVNDGGIPIKSVRHTLHLTKDASKKMITFAAPNESGMAKLLKSDADFNLSCITISYRLLPKVNEYLDRITASTDGFFFYASLDSGRILIIEDKLTEYRIHESTTNIGGTFQNFSTSILQQGLAEIRSLEVLQPAIQSNIVKKYLQREIYIKYLKLYAIVGKNANSELGVKFTDIVSSYGYTGLSKPFFLVWTLVYITSFLFGDFPRRAVYHYMNSIMVSR